MTPSRFPALARIGLMAAMVLVAAGCSSKAPEQPLTFNDGILDMSISQDWVLLRDAGKKAWFKHAVLDDVKLSFEDQTEDLGQPLTVSAVRGMIGSELNLKHGSVNARFGLGGCAVLSYARELDEGDPVFTQNWVVAHPYGYGAVARVAITLSAPPGRQATTEFQELIEVLDRQVGDAKMPEA